MNIEVIRFDEIIVAFGIFIIAIVVSFWATASAATYTMKISCVLDPGHPLKEPGQRKNRT